jgi:hypothetical protein
MKHIVETGLAASLGPFSCATVGQGLLSTALVPFDEHGNPVAGDVRVQTDRCLRNLVPCLIPDR